MQPAGFLCFLCLEIDVRFNRYTDSAQPSRVAPRSNMSNMLPRSALSAGRLDALGATRGFTTDRQDGNLLDDRHAETFEGDHFARVVGEQTNLSKTEITENLRADAYLILPSALTVRIVFTQRILSVRDDPAATVGKVFQPVSQPGLMQVNEHTATLFRDALPSNAR